MGIACGSQFRHFQSVFRLHDFLRHLMGRNGGRDEDNLLKPECLPNLFRTPEVAKMNGVESSSK
jgi:hypothetical protein